MPSRIEDYALIGDCQTAALVARNGSIDWLCFPRFDSAACFAGLLGTPEHGRWLLAPEGEIRATRRRYRDDTLILETEYDAAGGTVRIIDFMPLRSGFADLIRIVEGVRGEVAMHLELVMRFDYGSIIPWVRHIDGGITAIAGPDMLRFRAPVEMHGEDFRTVGQFTVKAGQRLAFDLTWFPSHQPLPREIDPEHALRDTEEFWREWSGRCTYDGRWSDAVRRSLITLKGLTYAPTGGIVAAATTSLPEHLGGVRNWDYRYCWLRDATLTLYALLVGGYLDEARHWREWLLRAAAGNPAQVHIMYGLCGERRLTELELPWLPGYENSSPVRIGNGAYNQFQLDVFGEVLDALYQCWRAGMEPGESGWRLERAFVNFLETAWQRPDMGIWEVRGPMRHFTHSKMMAWVAFDRAVKTVEHFGLTELVERWRAIRDQIHAEVCARGFNEKRGAFVQFYGSELLDASLLLMPQVGFLPADDPRVVGTVEAIQRELTHDGFVHRYETVPEVDGLPEGEGSFLFCTFWLVDCLELMGRHAEAERIFERLLAIRNDVGLLAEGYDVDARRLVGNFPQAFSHIGLINTARNLSRRQGPAEDRQQS
ncbi:MAG: glycoside hydrolase family 15 protein [Pseudomonadota bacterium]|nr:glycoside hydrolase family 15 protein [Pseudomonadota bacterium]